MNARTQSRKCFSTGAVGFLAVGLLIGVSNAAHAGSGYTTPSPTDCQKLEGKFDKVKKNRTTVSSATWVPEADPVPAHCLVDGFVTTGNRKQGFNQVNFRAWLPLPWNQKYRMRGGGGFAGTLPDASGILSRGYAEIATDTGHQASPFEASWAQDSPTKVIDFGYRGVHVTAVAGKKIIRSLYGKKPKYSYFEGCSRGGGQALMQAQRFPKDFDGIIAGAPAYYWSAFMSDLAVDQQLMYPDPDNAATPTLPLSKLPLLESLVDAKCDARDGIVDGIIDNPLKCRFDPETDIPMCQSNNEDSSSCMTENEVESVKAAYTGPVNRRGQIYPGFPVGGESVPGNWDVWIVGSEDLYGPGLPNLHYVFADSFFRYMAYEDNDDGSFRLHDFDVNKFRTLKPIGKILDSVDPELKKFRKGKRKLILWHGWTDAAASALGTIDYFENVIDEAGPRKTKQFARLFLAPGVGHCSGGEGPNEFDMLTALENWVEKGIPPSEIIAVRRDQNGQVDMERPLCRYPKVARQIDPNGSTVDASNFECVGRRH